MGIFGPKDQRLTDSTSLQAAGVVAQAIVEHLHAAWQQLRLIAEG